MSTRLCAVLIALSTACPVNAADPVDLAVFTALPRPAPTLEIRYGEASSQAIDVFLPVGAGPHPVALLIHDGCWTDTHGKMALSGLGRRR